MTIQIRFKISRSDFHLNCDLEIPERGITALYGPSGCGKTTLLRAIAGLDEHNHGFLQVADRIWQDGDTFVPVHKRALGYVFQEPGLFAHLNVKANIEYGINRNHEFRTADKLEQAIEMLGIRHLLDRQPHTLSGGEQQRVAICRALAVNPRLLLMDEPLNALDQQRKQEILPFLEAMHMELDIPVIYVSHAGEEVARLADHLVLMDHGEILGSGPARELLTRTDLPMARRDDAEAVIDAVVMDADAPDHLSVLEFSGEQFFISGAGLKEKQSVRLRIAARDVSLTLTRQTNTSILNIFPAVIDELVPVNDALIIVRILIQDTPLLARVTRRSARQLELAPGKKVYAQVKSVAAFTTTSGSISLEY